MLIVKDAREGNLCRKGWKMGNCQSVEGKAARKREGDGAWRIASSAPYLGRLKQSSLPPLIFGQWPTPSGERGEIGVRLDWSLRWSMLRVSRRRRLESPPGVGNGCQA